MTELTKENEDVLTIGGLSFIGLSIRASKVKSLTFKSFFEVVVSTNDLR